MGCCCCCGGSFRDAASGFPGSAALAQFAPGTSGSSSSSAASSEGRLDLNAASAAQLVALPGLGKQKAEAIIAYRLQHGPFASTEALVKVPGLGPATVAKFQALVYCGSGQAAGAAPNRPAPAPQAQSMPLAPVPLGAGPTNEALFFPDEALPCRYYVAGTGCPRKDCKFAHGGTGLCRLLTLLASARRTLDVAVYAITQEELVGALEAAKARGVAVRVICDDEQARDPRSLVGRLKAAGIPVLMDNSKQLHMHHKFAVLDGTAVIHGSFNWTGGAVKGSNENVVVSRGAFLVRSFAAEFARLWSDFSAGTVTKAPSSAVGGDTSVLFFPDMASTNVELIRAELLLARSSIDVAVFTLTLDLLVDALIVQHKRGVRVRVITDNQQSKVPGADAQRLSAEEVPVRMDRSFFAMHHKFAVVDGSTLINGSFNWTRQASLGNQENCVIFRQDQVLARSFVAQFDRLWAQFAS